MKYLKNAHYQQKLNFRRTTVHFLINALFLSSISGQQLAFSSLFDTIEATSSLERPAPMNRETKKSLTRQAIIDAAHHHLLQDGFRATDMKTIAKTAGISVVTLYKYFDSKDALTIAVGQKLITDNINHRIAILQRDDLDFVGKMKLYMDYEIHNDDDLPNDLKKFLANSFPARKELLATYDAQSDALWATLIPAGRQAGYIPDHISDEALKRYTEIFIHHFQNNQNTSPAMTPELENEIGYLFFFGLMGANLNEDEIR